MDLTCNSFLVHFIFKLMIIEFINRLIWYSMFLADEENHLVLINVLHNKKANAPAVCSFFWNPSEVYRLYLKKNQTQWNKKNHTHFQTINNNSLLPILFINVSIENINSIQIWKQNLPSEQYGMIMGRQVVTVINPRPEVFQRLVSVQ